VRTGVETLHPAYRIDNIVHGSRSKTTPPVLQDLPCHQWVPTTSGRKSGEIEFDASRNTRLELFAGRGRRGLRTVKRLITVQKSGSLRSAKLSASGEVVEKHMTAGAKQHQGPSFALEA
jgi:hypothetical protein